MLEPCRAGGPPRRRSPLLDLVRLTGPRRRGDGAPEVGVGLVAAPREAAVLTSVLADDPLAICPRSPVLLRPTGPTGCTPGSLAVALGGLLDVGQARVLLVGAPVSDGTDAERRVLADCLTRAADRGVPVIAPTGSGPSALVRHPWVVPVASCSLSGRLSWFVDFDEVHHGLVAPGQDVPGPRGPVSGNGLAAAVVAGTAALLWSLFPAAEGAQVRAALLIGAVNAHRSGPPLLDAQRGYEFLARLASTPRAWSATG